jgi:hypothetical protein
MGHPDPKEYWQDKRGTWFYPMDCPYHGEKQPHYASSDQCRECNKARHKARYRSVKKRQAEDMYAGMQLSVPLSTALKMRKQGLIDFKHDGTLVSAVELSPAVIDAELMVSAPVKRAKKPCKHCESYIRYVKNNQCVLCARARKKKEPSMMDLMIYGQADDTTT